MQPSSPQTVPRCPVCSSSQVRLITTAHAILQELPAKLTYRCSEGHTFLVPSEGKTP